eukprot:13465995-Alexandrium_andersonii.AAC.1
MDSATWDWAEFEVARGSRDAERSHHSYANSVQKHLRALSTDQAGRPTIDFVELSGKEPLRSRLWVYSETTGPTGAFGPDSKDFDFDWRLWAVQLPPTLKHWLWEIGRDDHGNWQGIEWCRIRPVAGTTDPNLHGRIPVWDFALKVR